MRKLVRYDGESSGQSIMMTIIITIITIMARATNIKRTYPVPGPRLRD